jgi:hypothetical protein
MASNSAIPTVQFPKETKRDSPLAFRTEEAFAVDVVTDIFLPTAKTPALQTVKSGAYTAVILVIVQST